MPKYVTGVPGGLKQVPQVTGENRYDRAVPTNACSMSKTPNSVIVVNGDGSNDGIGFFFGSSASFAKLNTTECNIWPRPILRYTIKYTSISLEWKCCYGSYFCI